jgi:molybdate transport system regulatory protein
MGGVLPKVRNSQRVGLRLRIVLREEVALGPGRADLLQSIRELGSIAAAGRSLGMSYKRAWTLVNSTSSEFGAPVVAAVAGGKSGGKAQLTDLARLIHKAEA